MDFIFEKFIVDTVVVAHFTHRKPHGNSRNHSHRSEYTSFYRCHRCTHSCRQKGESEIRKLILAGKVIILGLPQDSKEKRRNETGTNPHYWSEDRTDRRKERGAGRSWSRGQELPPIVKDKCWWRHITSWHVINTHTRCHLIPKKHSIDQNVHYQPSSSLLVFLRNFGLPGRLRTDHRKWMRI